MPIYQRKVKVGMLCIVILCLLVMDLYPINALRHLVHIDDYHSMAKNTAHLVGTSATDILTERSEDHEVDSYYEGIMLPSTPDDHISKGQVSDCDYLPTKSSLQMTRPWRVGVFMNAYNNLSDAALVDLKELADSSMVRESEMESHTIVAVKRLVIASRRNYLANAHYVIDQCGHIPWVVELRRSLVKRGVRLSPLPKYNLVNRRYYGTDVWTFIYAYQGHLFIFGESTYSLKTHEAYAGLLGLMFNGEYLPSERSLFILWGHGNMFFGMPNSGMKDGKSRPSMDPYGYERSDFSPSQRVFDGLSLNRLTTGLYKQKVINRRNLPEQDMKLFDIIGFDACLMANYEVLTAIEPYAEYIIASEVNESSNGWNYRSFSGVDRHYATLSTEAFIRMIVDSFAESQGRGRINWSLTGFHMGRFKSFINDFDILIQLAVNCFGGDSFVSLLDDIRHELPTLDDCTKGSLLQCSCWDMKQVLTYLATKGGSELISNSQSVFSEDSIERELIQPVSQLVLHERAQITRKSFANSIIYLRQKDDRNTGSGYGVLYDDFDSLGGLSLFYPPDGKQDNDECGSKSSQIYHQRVHQKVPSGTHWIDLWEDAYSPPAHCTMSRSDIEPQTLPWRQLIESGEVNLSYNNKTYFASDDTSSIAMDVIEVSITTGLYSDQTYLRVLSVRSLVGSPVHRSDPLITLSLDGKDPIGTLFLPGQWCTKEGILYHENLICDAYQDIQSTAPEDGMMLLMALDSETHSLVFVKLISDGQGWRTDGVLGTDLASLSILPSILSLSRHVLDDVDVYHVANKVVSETPMLLNMNGMALMRLVDVLAPSGIVKMTNIPMIHSHGYLPLKSDPDKELRRDYNDIRTDALLYRDIVPPLLGLREIHRVHGASSQGQGGQTLELMQTDRAGLDLSPTPMHFPDFEGDCDLETSCCSEEFLPFHVNGWSTLTNPKDYEALKVTIDSLDDETWRSLIQWAKITLPEKSTTIEGLICIKPNNDHATCITNSTNGTSLCICRDGYDGTNERCVRKPLTSRWTLAQGVPSFLLQHFVVNSQTDTKKDPPLKLYLMILLEALWQQRSLDLCAVTIDNQSRWNAGNLLVVNIGQPYASRYLIPAIGKAVRKRECKKLVEELFNVDQYDIPIDLQTDQVRDHVLGKLLESNQSIQLYPSGRVANQLFRFDGLYPPSHPRVSTEINDWVSKGGLNPEPEDPYEAELIKLRRLAYVTLYGSNYYLETLAPVIVYIDPRGIWWRRITLWHVSWLPLSVVETVPMYVWIILIYVVIPLILIMIVDIMLMLWKVYKRRSRAENNSTEVTLFELASSAVPETPIDIDMETRNISD